MKKTAFILAFCFASGLVGLQPASAQLVPPPAPVSPATAIKSSRPPQTTASQANTAAQQPGQTKLVRIYGGAGYFDNALAENLRPMLTKAFGTSRPDAPKAVPGAAVAAPAKDESQSKLTLAAHP